MSHVKVLTRPQRAIRSGNNLTTSPLDILEINDGKKLLISSNNKVFEWTLNEDNVTATTSMANTTTTSSSSKNGDAQQQQIKCQQSFLYSHWENHCIGSLLIDEGLFVSYSIRYVSLHKLAAKGQGDRMQLMASNHRISNVKLWRNEQLGVLIAVYGRENLTVWSLSEGRVIFDVMNVSNIFEDGLYAVMIHHDDVNGIFQIRRFSNETDHLIRDDSGQPLELTSNYLKQLIQLNNGNFVALSQKTHNLDIWSRCGATCRKLITEHTSDRITLKKRPIATGGFLTASLDRTIRGWNEDGECVFLCKGAHANGGIIQLSSGCIACGDGKKFEIWNPDTM